VLTNIQNNLLENITINMMLEYSNIYPTRRNVTQFILSGNCSTFLGGTTTHHQERKQLYLQHLLFVTPLLLPVAIMAELELQMAVTM
jgi:hypothetical protein